MKLKTIFASSAFLAILSLSAGCAARVGVGYRAYDPYRHDYHTWDDNEAHFYSQWTVDTHHDPHRDYRKLNKRDKDDYWKWRHDHNDHH